MIESVEYTVDITKHLISTIFTIGILLLTSMFFAEIFKRIKLPPIIGYLLAGIVFGPFALGGLFYFDGIQLVIFDNTINDIGMISAIIILFIAGTEIKPREFLHMGIKDFGVGLSGVIFPFLVGITVLPFLIPFSDTQVLLVSVSLTATSMVITVSILKERKIIHSEEGKIILGASFIDDVLTLVLLSVVISIIGGNSIDEIKINDIIFEILKTLVFFIVFLVGVIFFIPKILSLTEKVWKTESSTEAIVISLILIMASIGIMIGLSPLVGAFAIGMAVVNTNTIKRIKEHVEKIVIVLIPVFFAIIGAQVDIRDLTPFILLISAIFIGISISSKFVGTGVPAMLFLKDKRKATRVGIGMVPRGEICLIVAQTGLAAGILTSNMYTMIILMTVFSIIITPLLIQKL